MWEAVARLGALIINIGSLPAQSPASAALGAPPSTQHQVQEMELSGAELAHPLEEMSDKELRALRQSIERLHLVVSPHADEQIAQAAAAKTLQAVARGRALRNPTRVVKEKQRSFLDFFKGGS